MKTVQIHLKAKSNFESEIKKAKSIEPQLIFMFGGTDSFSEKGWARQVAREFPNANVIGCSTAGEIANNGVFDKTLVVTASHFHDPQFRTAWADIKSMESTKEGGRELAGKIDRKGLKAIFLLGRGLDINGSALIEGVHEVVGRDVLITGGLAGDEGRFKQTFTILNGEVSDKRVVALCIYGDNIHVAYGSKGGWEPFGPVRRVTKSKANVLYELDGEPALDIYKKYLGHKAKDLPASGLNYPIALLTDNQDNTGLIRTILAVNEQDKSMTFAGDIPQNGLVRLMHANNDGLVRGAKMAAESTFSRASTNDSYPGALGILISCVGRKIVMGSDIDDELDAVRDVFGGSTVTGFYSYGEICPQSGFSDCKLHNQTMTITYLYEKNAA